MSALGQKQTSRHSFDDVVSAGAVVVVSSGNYNIDLDRVLQISNAFTKTPLLALTETFGRPVEYRALDAEEWAQYMMRKWHLPEPLARSAMGTMRAIEAGEFDLESGDYQPITGRAPRSYRQFLREFKAARELAPN